jgi:putative ABC transport system ATP-binding protein
MAEAAVRTEGLGKRYGAGDAEVHALDGVGFTAAPGEFVAIMGPSGSGKSTLLHIVGALESPTSGSVTIAGRQLASLDDRELTRLRREHIGFVFQFFNLLPSLSALENVMLPALIAREATHEREARARELLVQVGLGGRADHRPSELSGGEQQRVSIARALLLSPELLLADEPTGNLDSRAGSQVLALIRELSRAGGHTVLMVTHDPVAAAVADRVVFLRDGRMAGEVPGGSTERVIDFYTSLLPTAEQVPALTAGGTAAGLPG